jgi:hypothetical protein
VLRVQLGRELVPFLARDFTCLAADAERRIGEETDGLTSLERDRPGWGAGSRSRDRLARHWRVADLRLRGYLRSNWLRLSRWPSRIWLRNVRLWLLTRILLRLLSWGGRLRKGSETK